MDVFDKREVILNLQADMLTGKQEKNSVFLALVSFENWCCNSGLSGFAQDFKESELDFIDSFGQEFDLEVVSRMIEVMRKFVEKYGLDFIDELTDIEHDELSQYDDDFYAIQDDYTFAVFNKYLNKLTHS